jgi:hypothetical protein
LAEGVQEIQHLFAIGWTELKYTALVVRIQRSQQVFHRTTIRDSGCIYFSGSSPLQAGGLQTSTP